MKSKYFLLVLFLVSSIMAQMPDFSKECKDAMSKLSVIAGKWEGDSWRMNPDRTKSEAFVSENIYFKLDDTVLMLEGLGKNADGEVVHNALAVVSYDSREKAYQMKSFLSNGMSTEADFEVLEPNKIFVWSMKDGRGGTIKYTLDFSSGDWFEIGEYSRDGEKWMKFFEMNLTKIE